MSEWTEEEGKRIVGLFSLLMKIDKRQNPHLYKKSNDIKRKN